MSTKKFTKKTIEELEKDIEETRKELYEIKFNVRIGRDKDYAQIQWKKRELARMLTVLQQKQSAPEASAEQEQIKAKGEKEEAVTEETKSKKKSKTSSTKK